jgi:hypothetical protein
MMHRPGAAAVPFSFVRAPGLVDSRPMPEQGDIGQGVTVLSGKPVSRDQVRDDPMPPSGEPGNGPLKTIAWLIFVAALAFGSGCVRADWIGRTLFTVDVTGVWYGELRTSVHRMELSIDLKQDGPKVEGSLLGKGFVPTLLRDVPGPVEGTVSGEGFEFRRTNGPLRAHMTVSGDEMTGQADTGFGPGQVFLRRVHSPPRVDAP